MLRKFLSLLGIRNRIVLPVQKPSSVLDTKHLFILNKEYKTLQGSIVTFDRFNSILTVMHKRGVPMDYVNPYTFLNN